MSTKLTVSDVNLWNKHLNKAGLTNDEITKMLPGVVLINNVRVNFVPLAKGQPGFKPSGEGKEFWCKLAHENKGSTVELSPAGALQPVDAALAKLEVVKPVEVKEVPVDVMDFDSKQE